MNQSIEVRMLNALEIFHYSYRFQNKLFILALSEAVELEEIVTDLRILHSAHIKTLVICPDDNKLNEVLQTWNNRGCPFEFIDKVSDGCLSQDQIQPLETMLTSDSIPVLSINKSDTDESFQMLLDRFTMDLASRLTVEKVFFLSMDEGLIIDNDFISHTTPDESTHYLSKSKKINIGQERLKYLIDQNKLFGIDVILLEGKSGCLFQEIFTHRGRGSLITSDYPNIIRQGKTSDVMNISLLMKPYVQTGAILPIDENQLASEIEKYYVYTVNNSIVAAAKFTDHGSVAELAKFCTLPRYQGKGRAKELAEKLIQSARNQNKKYIFALSIEPRMFDFFKNLGFEESDRENLPMMWKQNYDLTRPSKAFCYQI